MNSKQILFTNDRNKLKGLFSPGIGIFNPLSLMTGTFLSSKVLFAITRFISLLSHPDLDDSLTEEPLH